MLGNCPFVWSKYGYVGVRIFLLNTLSSYGRGQFLWKANLNFNCFFFLYKTVSFVLYVCN